MIAALTAFRAPAGDGRWSQPYVGLPWKERGASRDGVSCWGLVVLVYAEVLGIALPDYAADRVSPAERERIAEAFAEGRRLLPWRGVPEPEARAFDLLLFRRGGLDAHVGLVVVPGRMLHATSGADSAVVDYRTGRWSPRLAGVYRHPAFPEASHGL